MAPLKLWRELKFRVTEEEKRRLYGLKIISGRSLSQTVAEAITHQVDRSESDLAGKAQN